jgi:osmoprotectant transport system substrate-binding protein
VHGTRYRAWALGAVLAAAVTATATACAPSPAPQGSASALGDGAITVASYDFPESTLLARIYGTALRRDGHAVKYALGVGTRESVDPALARGLVELVPEYAGTALAFLSLGEKPQSSDVDATHAALTATLAGTDLVALAPAPAQDANAVVVTRGTATRYGLGTISDLRAVMRDLTFGGPPECPSRPFCLAGLKARYGLRFRAFLPLDAGGPLTRQALLQGRIDVGTLFSTDPALADGSLVALVDDRRLQPAENVTPLVHRSVVARGGDAVVALLDGVSGRLTSEVLRGLNAEVADGAAPAGVAARWLDRVGRP